METHDRVEVIACAEAEQWEAWLDEHHQRRVGVWLKIARRGSGVESITHAQALDVALCYGWIDSLRKSYDDSHFLQKYSSRRPKSSWSMVNVEKAEALIAAGRMQAPGLAEIVAARADGRWDAAYESQKKASVPPDLATALTQNERANSAFDRLDRTSRYAVILSLLKAANPATRSARLQKAIAKLEADAGT